VFPVTLQILCKFTSYIGNSFSTMCKEYLFTDYFKPPFSILKRTEQFTVSMQCTFE